MVILTSPLLLDSAIERLGDAEIVSGGFTVGLKLGVKEGALLFSPSSSLLLSPEALGDLDCGDGFVLGLKVGFFDLPFLFSSSLLLSELAKVGLSELAKVGAEVCGDFVKPRVGIEEGAFVLFLSLSSPSSLPLLLAVVLKVGERVWEGYGEGIEVLILDGIKVGNIVNSAEGDMDGIKVGIGEGIIVSTFEGGLALG